MQESNLSITSMITDRIGRQEVLLPVNHDRYDFWTQKIHFGQISPLETIPKVKTISILKISQIFYDKWLLWLLW